MYFLLQSIQITADIADGWTVGNLVIENQQAYLQLENGSIIHASGIIEVKNGDVYQRLTAEDYKSETKEGWPLYAGLRARMKQ